MITDWRGARRIGRAPLGEKLRSAPRAVLHLLIIATAFAALIVLLPLAVQIDFQFDRLGDVDSGRLARHAANAWALSMAIWSVIVAGIVARSSRTSAAAVAIIGLVLAAAVALAARTHILVAAPPGLSASVVRVTP